MVKLKNNIQELIGFECFTKKGVRANKHEYVFYHVEPTNMSVLPPDVIANKIRDLSLLLSSVPELEIMAIRIWAFHTATKSAGIRTWSSECLKTKSISVMRLIRSL